MITINDLMQINKDNAKDFSEDIDKNDIFALVNWLSEIDDKLRYPAFLLLQNRSLEHDDVYPFWDIFVGKLKSENSYQRSIGLTLIANNTKWDVKNKLNNTIDEYLELLNDDKPITIRQCIQALHNILPYKEDMQIKIADKLMSVDVFEIRETMRKLVLIDIINVLLEIRKYKKNNEIESYIIKVLSGGILDKKSKRNIESLFIK